MAEPQTTSQESAKIQVRESGDGARRAAAEPRSFAEGQPAAGMTPPAAVEAGRAMAESARRSGLEALDSFFGLQMDMNRWFDDMWRQMTGFGAFPGLRAARPFAAFSPAPLIGLPPTDVRETDKAYTLSVELPGLRKEDIDVHARNGLISICGHKAEQGEEATSAYRLSERRFGRFERTFPIPGDADAKAVDASFRDGLLTITLPKRVEAAAQGEQIKIKG
ncbi:Hsp20/alpha crystallin family protein [Phenylobacterium sp.]|uniref:Hsp20/alpha crystallin family protein n=1 Tax=Phenylobacterium sp. TaxID=1871053 RepID=UPI0035B4406B